MSPSGAGKSTMFHIAGMHDSLWSGEFYFGDRAIHKLNKKVRMEVHKQCTGFVFQSCHLLALPLSYRNIRKSGSDSSVCDMLDRFQMVGKKDLFPNQLSGGQQQLVGITRALVANPKIILAGESTGNLRFSQAKEIVETFQRLNDAGTTIVQVTHAEKNAEYANWVFNIVDGWIS